MTCNLPTCSRRPHAKGWCKTHYLRIVRTGEPEPTTARLDPIGHFWAQIDKRGPDECWLWTAKSRGGDKGQYGMIGARIGLTPSGTRLSHRIAYELTHGITVPRELHLDHLCRNTKCCNPAHLEPVTVKENVRRGLNGVLRTHCSKGHELTPANTYLRASDNSRHCRTCRREQARARRSA